MFSMSVSGHPGTIGSISGSNVSYAIAMLDYPIGVTVAGRAISRFGDVIASI